MRLVTDRDGTRYEVLATGETAWQLRAVVSGRETTLDPALLSPASLAPLEERGLGVDPASADALGVSDLLGLGVLERLADSGPTPVETLLTAAGACERELSGRLADLQVAGLIRRVDRPDGPGYALTDQAAVIIRDEAGPPDRH